MQTSALSPLSDLGTDALFISWELELKSGRVCSGSPWGLTVQRSHEVRRRLQAICTPHLLPPPPRPRRCRGGCFLLCPGSPKWEVHTENFPLPFPFFIYRLKILPGADAGSVCPPWRWCPVKWDPGLHHLIQLHPPLLRDRWLQTAE